MTRSKMRWTVADSPISRGLLAAIVWLASSTPGLTQQTPIVTGTDAKGFPPQSQPVAPPTPKPQAPAKPDPNRFPPNPLELNEPDPLLPNPNQPLSASDRKKLSTALDALSVQAAAQLQAGQVQPAFDTWNRELRLRRALGSIEEVTALGRIGEIAWQQNQTQELRYIRQRLQKIQADNPATSTSPEKDQLSNLLGIAYQLIRTPDLALSVYRPVLEAARQRNNAAGEFQALNDIGLVQLAWFKYGDAAKTYQDLLQISRTNQDRLNEALYLIQLTYIYEQAKQPKQAIPYLLDLITLYQDQPEVLPALKLRLAENYDAAGDFDNAEKTYQAAYTLAQPLSQSSYSGDALQKLGALYHRYDRLEAAQQVYDFLVDYGQTVQDLYISMNAADQLGQICLAQKNIPGAIAAFQQGLKFAQSLQLRPEYFSQKLAKIQQSQSSESPTAPDPKPSPTAPIAPTAK